MLKSKKFAVIISIVALIVVIYSVFSARKSSLPVSAQINQQPLMQPETVSAPQSALGGAEEEDLDKIEIDFNSETLLKRIYQLEPPLKIMPQLENSLKEEIFLLPETAEKSVLPEENKAEEEKETPELQGIIFSNYGKFAIINGKIYQQGESIGNRLIVQIGKDFLVLRNNNQEELLNLRSPLLVIKK